MEEEMTKPNFEGKEVHVSLNFDSNVYYSSTMETKLNEEGGKPIRLRKTSKMSAISVHDVSNMKPTTYTETFTHMIKGNIGCGMLAMGMAYKNGGILFTTILVLVIGAISCYNQYILVVMANDFKNTYKYERMSFSGTVKLAFEHGPMLLQKCAGFCRWSIEMFIIFTQLGFCCVYFMFVSESMQQIFNCYGIKINLQTLMVIVLPIFWLTSLIRELKYIAPLSTFANISIFAAFTLILYRSVFDLPPITERKLFGNWKDLPLCFGTIVYSLEGISLVLPLQQNMKNKERFLGLFGVLNISLFVVVFLMVTIGFFGYYKHGESVANSLTLNLVANNDILAQVVISCLVVGILCTFALQFFIPVLLIWPAVHKLTSSWPGGKTSVYEYVLRSVLVLVTFFFAELIPHLDLFVSLIGAVGSSFLALIYCPLADLARRQKADYGFLYWRVIIAAVSLFIGVMGFFVGTVVTLNDIIIAVRNDMKKSNLNF